MHGVVQVVPLFGLAGLCICPYNRGMENRIASRFVRALFFVCATFFCAPAFSFAQDIPSGTFVVRPSKVEISLAPGEEKTVMVRLSNGTAVPLHVETSFEDIAPQEQNTPVDDPVRLLGGVEGENSLQEFLSVSRSTFDLLSVKEVDVPVRVAVPAGTLPGGRYGSVVFTFAPALPSTKTAQNIAVQSRIAVVFYVRVTGTVKEEGKLVKFGLFNDERFAATPNADAPLRFQVVYENTGDVHENPHGAVTIRNMFGTTKAQLLVDPFAVLPGSTRMREINLFTSVFPGYYTATLDLSRGYGEDIDHEEVSFWVLPTMKATGIGLTLLILLGLIIRRSLRLSRSSLS